MAELDRDHTAEVEIDTRYDPAGVPIVTVAGELDVSNVDLLKASVASVTASRRTYSTLSGVSAAQGDVCAVGYFRGSSVQPLILRGDGASWALENAAAGAGINPWLTAVSGGSWAVGTASNGTADRTLVLKGPAAP